MEAIAEQCQFKEMRERYTLAMMGGSSYRDGVQYGFMRKGKITVNLDSMIIYNYVLHLLKVSDLSWPCFASACPFRTALSVTSNIFENLLFQFRL